MEFVRNVGIIIILLNNKCWLELAKTKKSFGG